MTFFSSAAAAGALLVLLLLLVVFTLPEPTAGAQEAARPPAPPAPRREFRGVWVATVANIDWPSARTLTTDAQKAELIVLLDRARQMNLNAIVLQVRPACDALYASPHEPWSEYLTGQMGKAPEPFYDPLTFAVEEAHKRGLELHAWFNPYRARQTSARGEPSADHISRTRPDLVRAYGKSLWLDPGEPDVQAHSLRVILDVVRRYDVDGVHLDDYFYPYKELDADKKPIEFPDDVSYARYQQAGGKLARNDWRRDNVDTFVRRLYDGVKAEKRWVRVGISPFGIWRPGFPAQIQGFDAFQELYADSRKWLVEGWVDYFSPQLYWKIEQTPQSYPVLLNWWTTQNPRGRHLWPGNFAGRAGGNSAAAWPADEIAYQVRATRGQAGASGNIHFSAKSFLVGGAGGMEGLPRLLTDTVYREPALVPATPWLNSGPLPAAPAEVSVKPATGGAVSLSWRAGGSAAATAPWLYLIQVRRGEAWTSAVIVPGSQTTHTVSGEKETPVAPVTAIAVSAVDRLGNTGPATVTVVPGAGGGTRTP